MGRDDPGAVHPQTVGEVRNVGDGAEVVLVGRRSTAWYSGADATPPTLVPGRAAPLTGPDEDAELIRVTDPPSHRSLAIDSTRRFVRYQRDGRSAHSNQTVRVCSGERLAGTVVVNNLGRVRSARPARETPCPHG